jgi:hypothetical protein
MAVPSLAAAPYTIASTVNTILTTGWQRSQSSTSSSSTGSSGGGGGGNQYTSNTGGYSHLSVPSINHLGSGCVGSGDSNAANMNASSSSPTAHGLAQLETLPSMYRDVRHLSKLKTFLSSSYSSSSSSSSSSKSTSSHYNHQMGTTMSDINHPPTSVDEEEFLFSYLEKVKLDPLSAASPSSSKQQHGGWNEAKFGHIFGRGGV